LALFTTGGVFGADSAPVAVAGGNVFFGLFVNGAFVTAADGLDPVFWL
jgi:hypothetical protein